MAQRTAFLNSDAKGFNKDFHHTWISNYMLKQPGVMFSNYSTKPEFALGNGQISGGKAIIRCTRTTGTFAGEEILACFESTATESISTSGNKKIYIEIPEVYVNDSTAITDTLTQGANLNVGRIVSSDSYPTHSNYIKLWEVTGGDWQNATDLRPEVLRRGKPNTLSYFGGNGEEERIDIDNASLNKYLMSNGAGVAPSWEEGGGGGGGGGGENFKRTFTADEDLLAKSVFGLETQAGTSSVNTSLDFGTTTATKVFFPVILNGEDFDSITLNLASVSSPADTLSVRVETLDGNGLPTGTLVDVGAYGTTTPTSTATDTTVNLSGTVSGLTAHTKAAVVIERSGSASDSNYYKLGCLNEVKVISELYKYNGSAYATASVSGCVDCDGFATEAIVQATSENGVSRTGYSETGATAGNDFTGILQGTVDYTGAIGGASYYVTSTGTLATNGDGDLVGVAIDKDVLQIGKTASSKKSYDAIVDASGAGDFTTTAAALAAGCKSIYIKAGTYTEETWDATNRSVYIFAEPGTQANFSSLTSSGNTGYVIRVTSGYDYHIEGVRFNISSGFAVFSSYQINSGNIQSFKVIDCVFNISGTTVKKMFYNNGGLESKNQIFNRGNVPGRNGFIGCYITTTYTELSLTETTSSYHTPYIRCNINAASTSLKGARASFEYCIISANNIQAELGGTGNRITIKTAYSSPCILNGLYDSNITITSDYTSALTIRNSYNTGIECQGTPSAVTLSGELIGCRLDFSDNATTVTADASVISGCYIDMANNSTLKLSDGEMVFVGNKVEGLSGMSIIVADVKECSGNIFTGSLSLGESGASGKLVHFSNNAVWSNSACSIYCTHGIIMGNKFGTTNYTKPVTFYSGAERNIFIGNYMYSCTLQQGANFNIVLGNVLYNNSSVSDSGTSNVVANNA